MTAFFRVRPGCGPTASPRRLHLAAGAGLGLLVALQAASAQSTKPAAAKTPPVTADPAATSATYGDWVLRCQRIGDPPQRLCEVSQTIQAQNQRDPIAEVAFGHLPPDPGLRLTVALPPSVSFPSTVTVASTTPTALSVDLPWKRCMPGSCFADAVPADDVVKAWRGMTGAGKIAFKDAGGHDVTLPVSFRGLSQALDALGK